MQTCRAVTSRRTWACRKAAWAVEDTPQDVELIYGAIGRKGLESIENVKPEKAGVVEGLPKELTA